jgi:8-oxo-dGTP pyrophosphatase MutT (NUDIX family)
MQLLLEKIQLELATALPGRPAQFEMTNIKRQLDYVVPEDARKAGVMLLLYPDTAQQMHIVFMVRTSKNPNDPHSGQVSFPGGKLEETDDSMLACALRETEEEVGIPSSDIRVLGKLTPLYIPISNFDVHPFVGFLAKAPNFVLQESEVKSIIQLPIEHFLSPSQKGETTITVHQFTMTDVPYFNANGIKIWGATSMILNEFLTVWQKGKQNRL